MKVLVDECVWARTSDILAEAGYELVPCRDVGLAGGTDEQLWKFAGRHKLLIITRNKDFGLLNERFNGRSSGVVLLRGGVADASRLHTVLLRMLADHGELRRNTLFVVEPTGYRIRRRAPR